MTLRIFDHMGKKLDRFETLRDEVEKALRPFVKLKIYRPEGATPEEHESLKEDEEFKERVGRLTDLYIRGKKEGFSVMIVPVKVPLDVTRVLEEDESFLEMLNDLAKGMAGKNERDSTD